MLVLEYLFKYMSEGAFHFSPNVLLLVCVFVQLIMRVRVGLHYLWDTHLKIQMNLLSLTFVLLSIV